MPTTRPATAYDWLTGTHVVRLALAAYYGACRISDTQQDADPVTDCHRLGFGERLAQLFEFKVLAHGHRTGVEGFPPGLEEYLARQLGVSLEIRAETPNLHRAHFL